MSNIENDYIKIKEYNEAFKNHLEQKLHQIDSNLNIKVEWYRLINKSKESKEQEDPLNISLYEDEVLIVLYPMPSRANGNGIIQQNLNIQVYHAQKQTEKIMDALTTYQSGVFQKKWWTQSGSLVTESWYSPTIAEDYVSKGIVKGALVEMQGVVNFAPEVLATEKVELCGEENELLEFHRTTTAESLPFNKVTTPQKQSKNRTTYLHYSIKCIFKNNIFCDVCDRWIDGELDPNYSFNIKYTKTNGTIVEKTVIISNASVDETDSTIPLLTAELTIKA